MLRKGAGMKKRGGMLLVVGGLTGYILRRRPAFSKGEMNTLCDCLELLVQADCSMSRWGSRSGYWEMAA